MILSAFASDRRPRTQIRPKLIAKTLKKAEKGACRRPTKNHPSVTSKLPCQQHMQASSSSARAAQVCMRSAFHNSHSHALHRAAQQQAHCCEDSDPCSVAFRSVLPDAHRQLWPHQSDGGVNNALPCLQRQSMPQAAFRADAARRRSGA